MAILIARISREPLDDLYETSSGDVTSPRNRYINLGLGGRGSSPTPSFLVEHLSYIFCNRVAMYVSRPLHFQPGII